jgi:hypothetical protein
MMKLSTLALIPLAVTGCPGSASKIHAKCLMDVKFENSCDSIIKEIENRVNSNSWTDPHNGGTYTITSSNSTYLAGQRVTGDEKYTDKFDYTFTSSGSGCNVEACSESQVMSIADFSTNYCNLHSLYCSSADGCPTAGTELTYTESYSHCSQHEDVCVSSYLTGQDVNKVCEEDIKQATADLTQAGIDIAKAVDDCAEGFSDACNSDLDNVLTELTTAARHITDAVYHCAGEEVTPCANDVNNILADITTATIMVMDAVNDCADNAKKCTQDIAGATEAIAKAGIDIAKATTDCA